MSCTEIACPTPTCEYAGEVYVVGEMFIDVDGCNECVCASDGSVGCTDMICPVDMVCSYDGEIHEPGDSFPSVDGCNKCTCNADGSVSCTEEACECNIAADWWRQYMSEDPGECRFLDYACPGDTFEFVNDCGCGCEQDAECPEWFDCADPDSCDLSLIEKTCPFSEIIT